jgi:protein required for attachment to host cells
MHRPPSVRFLLANASHARWVERRDHGFVTLSETGPRHIHQPAHPRGAVYESVGGGRHSAGQTDEAGRRRADFAQELACEINRQAADGSFERLAVVAPARLASG